MEQDCVSDISVSGKCLQQPDTSKRPRPFEYSTNCIFCDLSGPKHVKINKLGQRSLERTVYFDQKSAESVLKHARDINHLEILAKIEKFDLVEGGAMYHKSCKN